MIAFPDTSFLFALYLSQNTSPAADEYYERMEERLHVSVLLLFEFRQSVRFQIYRRASDPKQGHDQKNGLAALAQLEANIEAGALAVANADWMDVINRAERVSSRLTLKGGYRTVDILHVATAKHLGAREFLTFDAKQRELAAAEGLIPKP